MKVSRLAGLVVMAVLAMSLMTAAVASAAAPEFNPATPQAFTGESGTGALLAAGGAANIECKSDSNTGEVEGAKTVGSVVVTFSNCTATSGTKTCTAKSVGQPAASNTIVTKTLSGELGSVKTTQAASGVGLLLSPASGTTFVELEAGNCIAVNPSPVNGRVAGEATPVNGGLSKDGKLHFISTAAGEQKITEINVLGTVQKPELKALGLIKSSETTTELVLYSSAVEVT
jgi:hypothetical protein